MGTSEARLRRLLLGMLAVLAVAGLVLALEGDEDARPVGWLCFVVLGGFGLMLFLGYWRLRVLRPDLAGRVTLPNGAVTPALVLPIDARRQWAWIGSFALLAVASVVVALNPALMPRWSGVVPVAGPVIAVVLAIPVVSAIRGRHDQPMFALTPDGLLFHGLGSGGFVRWDAIVTVTTRKNRGGIPVLALDLTTHDALEVFGTFAVLGRWERSLTGHDVSFGLGLLPLPPDVSLGLVSHYLAHPEDRSRLGSGFEPLLQPVAGRLEAGQA